MERPVVGIWGDPGPLAVSILENSLANFCNVIIFSKAEKEWDEKTAHIENKRQIAKEKDLLNLRSIDYAILLDRPKEEAISIESKFRAKTLLVLNYRETQDDRQNFSLPENVGIVYVGDLLGPRMDLEQTNPLSRIIKDALSRKAIEISKDEIVFPVAISVVAKQIVRWLFSFGPYGEEVVIFSQEISTANLARYLGKIVADGRFVDKNRKTPSFRRDVRRYVLTTNIEKELKSTIEWFTKYKPVEKKERPDGRRLFVPGALAGVVLFISVLPFVFLAISFSSLVLSQKSIVTGDIQTARRFLSVAATASSVSQKGSLFFSSIPLVGRVYGPPVYFSSILKRVSNIGEKGIEVFGSVGELSAKIFGDAVYDPYPYAERIGLNLDYLYQEVSFLESDLAAADGYKRKLVFYFFRDYQLGEIKDVLLQGRTVFSFLPKILGVPQKKTYLVLFQNNMELRPTGGFIGSFAQVSFGSGRLIDISVSDVYSADGQLRGHVEPPSPIKNYLGEANWFLRDSNWDPDFPSSAQRAEWFLDKEIDATFDGVVAIDLEAVKRLLSELGPIDISDFGISVDHKNLYEKTQAEVEENFFPGSSKKTNFLTALTRELLTRLSRPEKKDLLGIAKAAFFSLRERHIQIFLHEDMVQKAIAGLGWDGSLPSFACWRNCFFDWFGVVEANLGVNKANYFIKRGFSLDVYFDGASLKRELSVSLENRANPALGRSAEYRAYLRVLAPLSANFGNVEVFGMGEKRASLSEINEVHGRKEAGIFIEVPAGQKKKVFVSWMDEAGVNFGQKGEYRLFWRKQAGTVNDDILATFHLPGGIFARGEPTPSLTRPGTLGYNTNLARDFVARIFW